MAEPIIYRITRKQSEKVLPILNKKGIYVESITRHLTKQSILAAAHTNKLNGIDIYVNEESRGKLEHNTFVYNEEYQSKWGNQPIYGNVIIILGPKAYECLPDELKIKDSDLVNIVL